MQRSLFATLLLLLLNAGLFAQAAPNVQEAAPAAPFELGTVTLTAPQIEAFKERGLQKLQDFQELSLLLADTSLAYDFRTQAYDMLLELFETNQEELLVYDESKQTLVIHSPLQYADQLREGKPHIQPLRFEYLHTDEASFQTDNHLFWTQSVRLLTDNPALSAHCQIQLVAIRAFRQTGTYGQISWKTYIKNFILLP